MSINIKSILITGASTGIGRATIEYLVRTDFTFMLECAILMR